MNITDIIKPFPLVAILRGIKQEQIVPVADCLIQQGIKCLEIPLNTHNALERISELVKHCGDDILIGAGTVLTPEQLQKVFETGAKLIVMPHCDTKLIAKAKQLNLYCLPGITTPTEAFNAIAAGADGLKLFPSEIMTPAATKALRAVLPKEMPLFPTGGISPEKIPAYIKAGANGFGLGSELFKPEYELTDIEKNAKEFITALRNIKNI